LEKLVIIPTYNEKENIQNIIGAVIGLGKQFHVLIIDDNSPDGTAKHCKNLYLQKYPRAIIFRTTPGQNKV